VTAADDTGTPLSVQNLQFGLTHLCESGSRWAIVTLLSGETDPSVWVCADDGGFSFKRVP